MLTERGQYQGKAEFFELNFQNGISQNTAKCKQGRLFLRQSHNYLIATFIEILHIFKLL